MFKLFHLIIPHPNNNFRPHLIRSKMLAIYCLILLVSQFGFIFVDTDLARKAVAATSITAQEIINLTNQERQSLGIPTLSVNSKLSSAAYQKGLDMFADQYWAHIAPDGTTPWDFILRGGYDYMYAGENLAKDFTTATGIMDAWMNSPSHRDNLINAQYKDIGVAVVSGNFNGSATVIVVQMFGTLQPQAPVQQPQAPAVTQPPQTTPTQTTKPPVSQIPPKTTPSQPVQTSVQVPVEKDTLAPQAPVITKPQNQAILQDVQPVIEGVAEANATVELFDQTSSLGSLAADTQNSFSFRPATSLSQGGHVLYAYATDKSGNRSDSSASTSIVIDTLPPFIDKSAIEVEPYWRFNDEAIRVRAVVLADPNQVIAKIGEYDLVLDNSSATTYEGVLIPPADILQSESEVVFSAVDKAGNSAEVKKEIPQLAANQSPLVSGTVLGQFSANTKTILGRIAPKSYQENIRLFYIVFGIGLVGLFMIDSRALFLRKIERDNSHSMAHAVVISLSLLGIMFGSFGVIL